MNDKPLKRYTIDISDLNQINIEIEIHERMVKWYEDYLEREGPYEYIQERIDYLNGNLCEYLIAREFAKEGARTYGDEENGV
jgi:hypothetical protein